MLLRIVTFQEIIVKRNAVPNNHSVIIWGYVPERLKKGGKINDVLPAKNLRLVQAVETR